MNNLNKKKTRAVVISADMGYGHQRATHPLRFLSSDETVLAAGYSGAVSPREKKLWRRMQTSYEWISRVKSIPLIGDPVFNMLDKLLHIEPYYPVRDQSEPSFQVKMLHTMIKRGLCSGILDSIDDKNTPIVASFYAPAIAAEMKGFKRIYCIICDADLNRVWVGCEPDKSKIIYLAPCGRARKRLRAYGIPKKQVFITGFPFDQSITGDKSLNILKNDLGQRLHYLDPQQRFRMMHGKNVEHFLGKENCEFRAERKLTITFAVGGAGAQKEIGARIAHSLKGKIKKGEVKLNLIAGVRSEVKDYFEQIKKSILPGCDDLYILFEEDNDSYFKGFNAIMRETDILWTKPSELSFFSALGIPIIMTPSIGSQEKHNKRWLQEIGSGIKQDNPDYAHQWLFDLLKYGRLAEAGWSGFLNGKKCGTFKIQEVLATGHMTEQFSPLHR